MDVMEKNKIPGLCQESNPYRPFRSLSISRLRYPGSMMDGDGFSICCIVNVMPRVVLYVCDYVDGGF
jgi:hypothetical protein